MRLGTIRRALMVAMMAGMAARASAAELRVLVSGGFRSTYLDLAPAFEARTGNHLVTVPSPSMGDTPEAVPNRLKRGEPADVLIMVQSALDRLVDQGLAERATETQVALSPIGVAVRAGAPKPDISTPEALKAALLAAKSVAYSDSASGRYVSGQLFDTLGIAAAMKPKAWAIPGTPVAEIVARGEADLGFQEVAEILPVKGATFVGRIPDSVQLITPFAAAVAMRSTHPKEAEMLVRSLTGPAVLPLLERNGLEPPRP